MSEPAESQELISAVLLFGSRARDDHTVGSDTDLLLVSPLRAPKHKSIGHLSMFFYPWNKLVADAQNGDLFVCHIVREAKPIFDPYRQLRTLQKIFRLRASYRREIEQARHVGWLLVRHADNLRTSIVARRMVWCVRTILIAKLAERGNPVFAPGQLAAMARSASATDILTERHRRRTDAQMWQRFHQFLAEEGGEPPLGADVPLESYRALFQQTNNSVGLQTLDSGMPAPDDDTSSYS